MITFNFWMGLLTGVAVGICVFFLYTALCLEKFEKKLNGENKK